MNQTDNLVLYGLIRIITKQKYYLTANDNVSIIAHLYVNQKENTCFKIHLLGKVLAVWVSIAGGFRLLTGAFTLDPCDWTMVVGNAARGLVPPASCVDIKINFITFWLV